MTFFLRSFRWGNPFPSSANPGNSGGRRRRRALLDAGGVGLVGEVGDFLTGNGTAAVVAHPSRRRALLLVAGVSHENDTVAVYCDAAACDWAKSVASMEGAVFSGVNEKVLAGWDSFSQVLFWMAVIFVAVLLLHLLVLYVIWPRFLPATPLPTFLVFPRIEVRITIHHYFILFIKYH